MADTIRNYRLVIVDDDETDRRFFRRFLAEQSNDLCEIREAADGAAGLAALRDQLPDCVLLDFSLPDMTGLEFLAAVAAADGELPCAIVLVTGQGNAAIAVAAMQHGVQDYLVKDQVNVRSLWRSITNAVAKTELRQRLDRSLRELTLSNAALGQEAAIRRAAEADLRRAKEIAEQADAAKTRFIAMVTHELRTPLNGILGYAELLRVEGGLSAQQEARFAAMLLAGRHLREMIEGVLDFAATESGQVVLRPARIAIRELTESCIGGIGPMATARHLGIRLVTAYDAPQQIIADPARMRQVLLNLLGNAVKYTESGSVELRVLAGETPGGLRIEVADTGRGIDPADRDRLFRDFERMDSNTSTEGAGLGLAIAARTVARMGGTIGHAPNPAGGSVFWLELPAGEAIAPAESRAVSPAQPLSQPLRMLPPLPSGWRVLLVDDIEMNHEVIGAFLRAAGHDVVLARGGHEAVQLARDQAFDLILMDLRMPEMDGLEATRRIRALPAPRGTVPILALTATTMRDQVTQCRQVGMDGHIAKPVDYATLMVAVADAIASPASRWTVNGAIAASAKVAERQLIEPAPGAEIGAAVGAAVGAEVAAGAEPEMPAKCQFNRATMDQTLAFLSPEQAATQLQSLRDRHTQMLLLLDQPAAPELLADAAHTLSSAAGMFGFAALADAAREFEQALSRGAPETDRLAQHVRAATGSALTALDAVVRECQMQPA